MRLQEIYEKLEAAKIDVIFNNFPGEPVITNIQALRNRLEFLDGVPGFKTQLDKLKSSIIFRTDSDRLNLPPPEWNDLRNSVAALDINLQGVKKFLQAELANQDPLSVFIKLPPTEDLKNVIGYENKFTTALEQLVLLEGVGGQIKLKSWEKGSFWLELTVGGPLIVGLVGATAWAAAVVWKKSQEAKMFGEFVKGLKLKNESMENIVEAQKEMLDTMVEAEAINIANQHLNGTTDPETLQRVKFSIKELAGLINEGAEIHPALKAPENVSNLFPDFKKLTLVESKTKMIEDKK